MPQTELDNSRIQGDYDKEFNDIVGRNKVADDLENLENSSGLSTKDLGNNDIKNSEESGNGVDFKSSEQTWENRVTPHKVLDKGKLGTALTFAKKHKGFLGLISVFGVSGALLSTFFGPASMIINLVENLSITNDTSSRSLESRFLKVFQNASTQDPICASTKVTIRCSMGSMSESGLRTLKKKGVTAIINGAPYEPKLIGYPKGKIEAYQIDLGDGSAPKNIKVEDLSGFMSQPENRKFAARVLGTGGAMNLRVKTWAGKHIYSKFYNKFGLRLNGGLAAMVKTMEGNTAAKLAAYRERLPGSQKIAELETNLRTKINDQLGKVKKAGSAYLIAVGGCMGVKAPSLIAGGAAAVQLTQVINPTMDYILSPGSMAKASGLTESFTPESMDVIGTSLTEQIPRESDMKPSSALDSAYLLAALGVNKAKPAPSQKYTPGYALLTNKEFQFMDNVKQETKPACTKIMSPTAMYTAMATDIGLTVAASATVIGGLVKVAGTWAVSELVSELTKNIIAGVAKDYFVKMAENKDIPNARGEALGDVLGIGAAAFFAGGGMSRHLPAISKSQLAEAATNQNIAENMRKEMDIASLSPLDTSSRYTFLGSIVHNIKFAMLANNSYNDNVYSTLSNVVRLPQLAMSIATPKVGALGVDITKTCDYAEYFGLNTGDEYTTPAINIAGLPCVAYTSEQLAMSPVEAIDLVTQEGWLDENVNISMSDSISDLVSKGFIRPDTPLADFISECGDPSTGDYLFNSAGCIVPQGAKTSGTTNYCGQTTNDRGEAVQSCADVTDIGNEQINYVKNPRSLQAISVFLGDYQVAKSLNGEDEGYGEGSSNNARSESISLVNPTDWAVPANHNGSINKQSEQWKRWVVDVGDNGNTSTGALKPIDPATTNICPQSNNLNRNGGGNLFNPNAAASARALIDSYNQAHPGRYLVPGACFRSKAAQEIAYQNYKNGGNLAATPGTSNHGWGLAIDFRIGTNANDLGTSIASFSSNDYLWMASNSPQFGWVNPVAMRPSGGCSGSSCEAWHFQYVGPLYAN